jgi:DNA-binding NarL/FixJ family response regulator/AraC-like DNA-binding protein
LSAACRLLVADDEPWVVENLRGLVDWRGLSVEFLAPAGDGEEALSRIESERPDILITDINMPFVDGNELIRRAKAFFPDLQVIVLSGYDDFEYVRDALLHGAVDYLLKPVARGALIEVLERAMRLIGSARDRDREEGELRARLLAASSLLRDGELSAALQSGAPAARGKAVTGALLELELELASFVLVLAKLARRRDDKRDFVETVERLRDDLASILSQAYPETKGVSFRNICARGEFVLVSDADPEAVAAGLEDLRIRLERRSGLKVDVAASRPRYSLGELRESYQEAKAVLGCRSIGGEGVAVSPGGESRPRKRISPELENRLAFALESKNKPLAEGVIFDEIGLRLCADSGWLLVEARQTAEYVAGMIYHRADPGPAASPRSRLEMDELGELLGAALEDEDVPEACGVLGRLLDEAFGGLSVPGASGGMVSAARRAQLYIGEHYFEDISTTSVASVLKVDCDYLSKAFKQVTGCNLMLAIARARIDKAREYIMRGDLSLTDVADLVGYGDYAYFNRVFRKVAGMSPSDFRDSLPGGAE